MGWKKHSLPGKAKSCSYKQSKWKQNKELIRYFPLAGSCSATPRTAGSITHNRSLRWQTLSLQMFCILPSFSEVLLLSMIPYGMGYLFGQSRSADLRPPSATCTISVPCWPSSTRSVSRTKSPWHCASAALQQLQHWCVITTTFIKNTKYSTIQAPTKKTNSIAAKPMRVPWWIGQKFISSYTRAALKVTPPICLCWAMISEADADGRALEAEPSWQYSFAFCCHVTNDSRTDGSLTECCLIWKCIWNKGVSLNSPLWKNSIHWHFLNVDGDQSVDVSTVKQWVVCFSSSDSNAKDKPHSRWPNTFLWTWHAGSCSPLAKMHS